MKKQDKSPSPYSPGEDLKEIELPNSVIIHYQKRGMFLRSLPSYEQVKGSDSYIPEALLKERGVDIQGNKWALYNVESCPVRNKEGGEEQAINHTIDLLSRFSRERKRYISRPTRDYALLGRTKPIRISGTIDGHIRVTVYVKKPSTLRIFGIELYNILSGRPRQEFLFSRHVFLETPVAGIHMTANNRRRLSKRKNFVESLVRLSTLDDFMEINDLDMEVDPDETLSNVLLDNQGNVSAFDFNNLLHPAIQRNDPLIVKMMINGIKIPQNLEKKIRINESEKIMSRIRRNQGKFDEVINLMDKTPYMKRIFEEKGYKSAKRFFKSKMNILGLQIKY